MPKPDSLQGSLDLLVLKILSRRPRLHGYAIMSAIQDMSGEVLRADPAWELAALSPSNARFYSRLGWELWRGPLAIRHEDRIEPTPSDEEVMILRLPRTPVTLFTSSLVTGWYYRGSRENLEGKTETADGRIKVSDGVIVMMEKDTKGKGGIRDLYTIRTWPKAFHLKLEFRASLKSDSGVYVRGPQLQVRDFIRRNEHRHLKKFKNDD